MRISPFVLFQFFLAALHAFYNSPPMTAEQMTNYDVWLVWPALDKPLPSECLHHD
jgi:hypothetical protein